MSNFYCQYCGAQILEGNNGEYITGCKHYPIKRLDNDVLVSAYEFLQDLASEWGWKRNSTKKNSTEMSSLDCTIMKLKQEIEKGTDNEA